MNSVFIKTLRAKAWFTVGWMLGFAGVAALMVSFYPAMNQEGALDMFVETMPPAFEGLIGNLAYLKSFDTYLASQLFDIRMPLIAGIMAIILAQSLSTHEEERGELRTLLGLPLSRASLFWQKWAAFSVITFIAIVGLAIGTYSTIPVTTGADIEFTVFIRLVMMTWLLMLAYGAIAFAVGMVAGRKGIATFVSTVVIIGSFLVTTFTPAVDWIAPYGSFSLLHFFPAVEVVQYGLAKKDIVTLLLVIVVALGFALEVFRRRDIRS